MSRKGVNTKAKIKIVFYGHCGNRNSTLKSQDEAEEAAQRYSRQAGYACEAFLCDKHLSSKGNPLERWHVRWVGESQHGN